MRCPSHLALLFVVQSLLAGNVQSFSSTPPTSESQKTAIQLSTKTQRRSSEGASRRKACYRCPDDVEDDPDMARRETFFAVVGMATAIGLPSVAGATYGQDAKIEVPNPVETMADRVNGQCLVETLGNRECLVYLDPANKLYQGADTAVLLQRVEKASEALASVPVLVESKKWSQVSGVLTGPLGTLVTTMNQLIKLSGDAPLAKEFAAKTKIDIIAIGQASEKKEGDKALLAHQKATQDLVAFVKSL